MANIPLPGEHYTPHGAQDVPRSHTTKDYHSGPQGEIHLERINHKPHLHHPGRTAQPQPILRFLELQRQDHHLRQGEGRHGSDIRQVFIASLHTRITWCSTSESGTNKYPKYQILCKP